MRRKGTSLEDGELIMELSNDESMRSSLTLLGITMCFVYLGYQLD